MILLKLETKIQPSFNDAIMQCTLTFASHPSYKGTHLVDVDNNPINKVTLLDDSTHCRRILIGMSIKRYALVRPLKLFFRTKLKMKLKEIFNGLDANRS